MFIQTEETPNPATLKFIPGVTVMNSGTVDFASKDAAGRSPLATRLFDIAGVSRVFFGNDFITVSSDGAPWHMLKPPILGAIMEHFTTGQPLLVPGAESAASGAPAGDSDADPAVVSQIKELLDTRVRPAVAQDGGDIVFHDFKDGIVYLHMQGSCSGCPSSSATLKNGIENLLKHYVPEVQAVQQI